MEQTIERKNMFFRDPAGEEVEIMVVTQVTDGDFDNGKVIGIQVLSGSDAALSLTRKVFEGTHVLDRRNRKSMSRRALEEGGIILTHEED